VDRSSRANFPDSVLRTPAGVDLSGSRDIRSVWLARSILAVLVVGYLSWLYVAGRGFYFHVFDEWLLVANRADPSLAAYFRPFNGHLIALPVLVYCIHDAKLTESNPYGFKASFNPTFPGQAGDPHGWVSPWHFGLNQGPIILMIENHRTGLLWRLTRHCPYIVSGLRRAGFAGGWL